jgi:hypothetical protein
MKWFRVYSEIKDDPKMLEMDDHQRWLWICLMSLANDSEQRGTILNVRLRGLASSLRTTEDKLRDALELYQELDMAEYDEDARTITLLNFIKRQYDKPSDEPEQTRERQRTSRQRHATVTPSHALYTDTDTDTETETDTENERGATFTPGPVVARASVTRTVGTKPNPKLSPAVNAFAQVTGKFPPRGIHHLIDAAFETRDDPDLLRRCYETWLARGYRPENIAWLQEWYTAGAIPSQTRNGNGKSPETPAADY